MSGHFSSPPAFYCRLVAAVVCSILDLFGEALPRYPTYDATPNYCHFPVDNPGAALLTLIPDGWLLFRRRRRVHYQPGAP